MDIDIRGTGTCVLRQGSKSRGNENLCGGPFGTRNLRGNLNLRVIAFVDNHDPPITVLLFHKLENVCPVAHGSVPVTTIQDIHGVLELVLQVFLGLCGEP